MTKQEAENKLKFLAEMAHDLIKKFDPASDLLEIIVVNGMANIRTDMNSKNYIHISGHQIGGYDGRKDQT